MRALSGRLHRVGGAAAPVAVAVAVLAISLLASGLSRRSTEPSSFTPGAPSGGATRTWVSGVGDDANPCSRTAPCKTFAGAISKTASPGGQIDALDPGGFGGVTIQKGITISGAPTGTAGVLTSGTNAIVVNALSTEMVTLKNLHINGIATGGSLAGVKFLAGKSLTIEDSVIENFGVGVLFNPAAGGTLIIRNSVISNGVNSGVEVSSTSGTSKVEIINSQINGWQYGVRALDNAKVSVRSSNVSNNSVGGLGCTTSTASHCTLTAEENEITHNGAGVYAGRTSTGVATVSLYGNTISFNNQGIIHPGSAGGGVKIVSFGDNRLSGNGADGTATETKTRL